MDDKTPKRDNRLIGKKEEWARIGRGLTGRDPSSTGRPRLPPGQRLSKGFPVLDLGIRPEIDPETWELSIVGLVANPIVWRWDDFLAQPKIEDVSDFHCVTAWSTFDNRWEGVPFKKIIDTVRPKPEAVHLLFTAFDNYTTNLPLSVCNDDDVMLAWAWGGKPLTRDHGGPVRMLVPKRYGWKSAKWLKEIVFAADDRPGFWEVRGYSNSADPWKEERYATVGNRYLDQAPR
ncbi:MAG TPA: sulfite oxidase-like oxidoreductase [Nitrospiria bacterium]|nr:sulfite oxidase-like oxidoreductase [Nitrospiria bacterium]